MKYGFWVVRVKHLGPSTIALMYVGEYDGRPVYLRLAGLPEYFDLECVIEKKALGYPDVDLKFHLLTLHHHRNSRIS